MLLKRFFFFWEKNSSTTLKQTDEIPQNQSKFIKVGKLRKFQKAS